MAAHERAKCAIRIAHRPGESAVPAAELPSLHGGRRRRATLESWPIAAQQCPTTVFKLITYVTSAGECLRWPGAALCNLRPWRGMACTWTIEKSNRARCRSRVWLRTLNGSRTKASKGDRPPGPGEVDGPHAK